MPPHLLPLAYKMLGHSAGLIGVGGIVAAAIDFTSTITLGSVILGAIAVLIAAIFTSRSKIANIWRQEAEGERAAKERVQEELVEERLDRVEFEKQQQELRHELKNEIAGLRAQLQVMEAKTDLTKALVAIKDMNEASINTIAAVINDTFVEKSREEHAETHRLLTEIRDKLPIEPMFVHEAQGPKPKES